MKKIFFILTALLSISYFLSATPHYEVTIKNESLYPLIVKSFSSNNELDSTNTIGTKSELKISFTNHYSITSEIIGPFSPKIFENLKKTPQLTVNFRIDEESQTVLLEGFDEKNTRIFSGQMSEPVQEEEEEEEIDPEDLLPAPQGYEEEEEEEDFLVPQVK